METPQVSYNMDKITEIIHKLKLPIETSYFLQNYFWRLCPESNLRTFSIYVAETIYALCPEIFCAE